MNLLLKYSSCVANGQSGSHAAGARGTRFLRAVIYLLRDILPQKYIWRNMFCPNVFAVGLCPCMRNGK